MFLVKPLRHGSSANELLDWLASQEEAMVALLRMLVDIDSGSYDKAGVDRVGGEIRRFLEHDGLDCQCLPQNRYGDILRAQVAGEASDGPNILLMSHRDTTCPSGESGPQVLQD